MLDEDKLAKAETLSFMDNMKLILYRTLKKNAFLAVTLCASIPNPLFDLAGLTCGHFLIPFGVFFGATFIGKSIIKVSIQSIFIILSFSQHHVEGILSLIENNFPTLRGALTNAIDKQKKALFSESSGDEAKPLVAALWEYFVAAMILYFVVSIINSLVQNYVQEQHDDEAKKKKTI